MKKEAIKSVSIERRYLYWDINLVLDKQLPSRLCIITAPFRSEDNFNQPVCRFLIDVCRQAEQYEICFQEYMTKKSPIIVIAEKIEYLEAFKKYVDSEVRKK